MQPATSSSVIVLIPAYMEEARIADTVAAARALPGVTRVVVIDDGSTDRTAKRAEQAGAEVICRQKNAGKGAALRAGLAACPGADDDIFLLLDADLGATAAEAGKLLTPVLADEADLAIARFPQAPGKGGFGLVKGLARWGTWLLTRQQLAAPISGQRACRRWVLDAAPIADGYGVEVAMNVAAGDAGARIMEVPVEMAHSFTGRNLRGFKHRGRQYAHIFGALLAAAFGRTGEHILGVINPFRSLAWLIALALAWTPASYVLGLGKIPRLGPLLSIMLVVLVATLFAALLSGVLRARRKNFSGRYIPSLGGLALLPVLVFMLFVRLDLAGNAQEAPDTQSPKVLLSLFLLGWMLLGLIDDVAGNAERKGFRGHIQSLLHGKLTTGGVKLLGGGILALALAWFLPHAGQPAWLAVPLHALLIALSANALNLFDLRPGRALKVFWLVAFPLAIILPSLFLSSIFALITLVILYLLLIATLVYAPFDFSGMMMLGDTGSNPLGAFVGLCLALSLPLYGQVIALMVLVALHIYAERASITRTIEHIPWLRWIDQLGRS